MLMHFPFDVQNVNICIVAHVNVKKNVASLVFHGHKICIILFHLSALKRLGSWVIKLAFDAVFLFSQGFPCNLVIFCCHKMWLASFFYGHKMFH